MIWNGRRKRGSSEGKRKIVKERKTKMQNESTKTQEKEKRRKRI